MKELLVVATEYAVLIVNAIALLTIFLGTMEAFFTALWMLFTGRDGYRRRAIWLRYAHWLVAGMTFQLASDIVETSIAPTWDDLGRLAVIAVIRTGLNFFLERDLSEIRERQRDSQRTQSS
ncbi:hypothetical protein NB311A_08864 [Nitrobacter sp. Nb-311A]|uniref:DUF1622 domain-containing protein n=1 Tax=Nitrobacter sp. Nb-311A TaxID=314253 RepID=UPI00006862F3|nr:DUF1622 domain-containing protein [Nitrobacter sp. Nb-311A]EAQ33767.1 hypothetical protein NB311A_08864 [Nitrobacter sp. Nb-311A]